MCDYLTSVRLAGGSQGAGSGRNNCAVSNLLLRQKEKTESIM